MQCGMVMPYGIIEICLHWFSQAITWTNIDVLLIDLSGRNFSEIFMYTNIYIVIYANIYKLFPRKFISKWPFCLESCVLTIQNLNDLKLYLVH